MAAACASSACFRRSVANARAAFASLRAFVALASARSAAASAMRTIPAIAPSSAFCFFFSPLLMVPCLSGPSGPVVGAKAPPIPPENAGVVPGLFRPNTTTGCISGATTPTRGMWVRLGAGAFLSGVCKHATPQPAGSGRPGRVTGWGFGRVDHKGWEQGSAQTTTCCVWQVCSWSGRTGWP